MSTAARKSNYLEPAHLAALVREHRRTGAVSDGLGRALLAIAGGVWDRYQFTHDRDDFVQDAAVHLMGNPLRNADPHKNLFAYLTTCVIRYGLKLRDKAAGDRRRFESYARDLADAGAEIPERD